MYLEQEIKDLKVASLAGIQPTPPNPETPFAGIEMVVLFFALYYIDRHAADYERITIWGDRVTVEVREGSEVSRAELNRYWAQVVCEGPRLALRSHGREIEVGRHVCEGERRQMARDLALGLRRI